MQRRIAVPLVFGVIGTAILIGLGLWQVQRLDEKETELARIDARIADAPVGLPQSPSETVDKYRAVKMEGTFLRPELHVLVGIKDIGAGYRVIQPYETDGRRILVDRGFIKLDAKDDERTPGPAQVIGNLHWPDEVDGYTPAPDEARAIWFARDIPAMADALGTEPLLVVARQEASPMASRVRALPVDSAGIPNDHLQYAITWFSLAVIWAGMTGYFLWRTAGTTRAAKGKAT
ncbi:SURF1 family protein [Roseovarius pelagicus]|uniref:SURF1-like protein n=1 Tax=Roseovarius pelagicus TaxID=2980108 RepID=A0ABY6D8N8_9RHOB|nr:SURF1 family protein [Roseovarius pelagicus]UXX82492.1 SURF1 family protein [Roseovarius pelagicus]